VGLLSSGVCVGGGQGGIRGFWVFSLFIYEFGSVLRMGVL
jgi:hypothetical protein